MVQSYRRRFLVAAWDHYTSGGAEVLLMLPTTERAFPISFDSMNIIWSGWDAVRDHFLATGELSLGRATVDPVTYAAWEAEGDFITGGTFDGDFRDFVTSTGPR